MGITREESLSRFGTEKYTAWDLPGANADAQPKGLNVMQKQPNPAQVNQTIQANKGGFKPIKGFSNLQNQYAENMATPPDYQALYGQYSNETGLTDVKKLVLDLDNTLFDIEDKINKIEPQINKEVGDYLINDQQRGRMVNAEQYPLRTQYSQMLSNRSRLSAEATAKADLVNTLMGYASTAYSQKNDYLKALMDIEKSNKSAGTGGATIPLKTTKETMPIDPPEGPKGIDDIFKDVTIDKSGTIQTKPSGNLKLDKNGNLILGGGVKLNNKTNNKSLFSLAR